MSEFIKPKFKNGLKVTALSADNKDKLIQAEQLKISIKKPTADNMNAMAKLAHEISNNLHKIKKLTNET